MKFFAGKIAGLFALRFAAGTICALASGTPEIFAETEVDIRGMRSKSESEVLQLIGGRLVYVRQKTASTWRANDAAFLVERILRDDGFFEAEVRGKVEASDLIVLTVDEGLRLSLGQISIKGADNTEDLVEVFKTPFESSTPLGGGSAPFRAEDVPEGLEFVSRKLKSEGYWSSEVTLAEQEISRETGEVNMVVSVFRGPEFTIGTPTVDSPDGRGVKRSATTWEPYIGKKATTENITKLKAEMVEAFISRGYPDAEIFMNRRLGNETYYPEFRIELGVRVKLLNVKSEGLERTKPKRVKQIMAPLEGDWYDEAAMNAKVRDLLATGAFSSVRVETSEVARKRIDATLHFEEAKAKEVTLSAGVGSFNGPLFRSTYTDRNFRGKLRAFSAGFELSGRGVLGEIKLVDPWWRGTDISRELRLFSMIKAYEGYTTYETGFDSKWIWKATENYSVDFLLGYSHVSVSDEGLPLRFLGDDQYSHVKMAVTQKWDYRDNVVLPKSGWHVSVPVQIGAAIGDETHTYLKAGLDGGWYHPLGDSWQLGIGGFAQWVLPSGEIQDLPVDLRVFNGGPRSVRSFPERELGPSFGGDPFGGDFSWAVNTELSRNLTSSLRAVAFVDAGGVTGDYVGLREGGLELAAGLGLRLDLPIGPVRLEYGHNLTQGAGEPGGTWHFAIGATF